VGSVRRAAEHATPDRESPDHLRLEARGNPVHRRGPSAARANYRPFRWITWELGGIAASASYQGARASRPRSTSTASETVAARAMPACRRGGGRRSAGSACGAGPGLIDAPSRIRSTPPDCSHLRAARGDAAQPRRAARPRLAGRPGAL